MSIEKPLVLRYLMVILSKAKYYIEYFFCSNTLRLHTPIKRGGDATGLVFHITSW